MSAYSCDRIRDSAHISRIHGRVKGLYRLICVTISDAGQAVPLGRRVPLWEH